MLLFQDLFGAMDIVMPGMVVKPAMVRRFGRERVDDLGLMKLGDLLGLVPQSFNTSSVCSPSSGEPVMILGVKPENFITLPTVR